MEIRGRRLAGGGVGKRWRQALNVGHLRVFPMKGRNSLSRTRTKGRGVGGDSTSLALSSPSHLLNWDTDLKQEGCQESLSKI